MRKIVGTVILTAMLLVPAQIVMADNVVYTPAIEMMMKTEMKMTEVMMKMMKARKKGMSSRMEKKLMKMLHDLDTLLDSTLAEI